MHFLHSKHNRANLMLTKLLFYSLMEGFRYLDIILESAAQSTLQFSHYFIRSNTICLFKSVFEKSHRLSFIYFIVVVFSMWGKDWLTFQVTSTEKCEIMRFCTGICFPTRIYSNRPLFNKWNKIPGLPFWKCRSMIMCTSHVDTRIFEIRSGQDESFTLVLNTLEVFNCYI